MDLLISLSDEIKGYFRAKCGDAALAEDLYQDMIISLMASETFKVAENPRAYAYSTANNLLIDQFRKRAARDRLAKAVAQENMVDMEPIDGERILEARMKLKAVFNALEELPELTRKIFQLVRIKGLKQRETAEQLGVTQRTVERHLARALAHCHKRVQN